MWGYGVDSDPEKVIPEITKPKDFNVLTLSQLSEEYKNASQSNVSDDYLRHLETELVAAKFINDGEKKGRELAVISLQPFPGKGPDELLTIQNLPSVQEWQIYKQLNIGDLVDTAIMEQKDFLSLSRLEQKAIIDEMAKKAVEPEEEPPAVVVQGEEEQTTVINNEEERGG